MALHRFTIGQKLEFVRGRLDPGATGGTYTVLRLLPNDGLDRKYRVKNDRDGHERVCRESQLRGQQAAGSAA